MSNEEHAQDAVTVSPQDVATPDDGSTNLEDDNWEHKYKVLQGKYNAEVPRLQKEARMLRESNMQLMDKIALLEKIVLERTAESSRVSKDSTEEDLSKFKEEFPDIYRAVSKMLTKNVDEKIKPVEAQTQQMQIQGFYQSLTMMVPEWQQLNTDPDFLDWLREADSLTGRTRQDMLTEAYQRLDAHTVANFFKNFRNLQQQANPQTTTTTTTKTTNIAPPAGKAYNVSSGASSKKTFTQSEIEAFYRKAALNKIGQKEKARIEKEIADAIKDGRVLYNR